MSDTCSTAIRTRRDVLFQLFEYQQLASRFSVARATDLSKNKEDILQAHKKLLNREEGSEKLDSSLLRTCADVYFAV